jgi:antitoxin ParD1/3/4
LLRANWRLKPQLYNQSPPTRTDIRVDARLNRTVLRVEVTFDRQYGVKSVNIELKSEQELFIRSQIESGEYQNADDVISEAFKLLAARSNRIEQLRQKIAVGTAEIANGQMTDREVIFERLQAKIDLIARDNDL